MGTQRLLQWLDERTAGGRLGSASRSAQLPGGARWRHAWSGTLAFVFFVQAVTGFFLWTSYSPSTQTAWESVFYAQHHLQGGWFLRGLHHYTAQLLVLLLGLHVAVAVVRRAYRAPREIRYWLLLALVPLAVASSVTGWLLPFDQRGYWAARVPLNILGVIPVLGPPLQQLLLGGAEVGHLTLTRFFALHAGLLPLAFGAVLGGRLWLEGRYRRLEPPTSAGAGGPYWPDQCLKNAVVWLALLALPVGLVIGRHGVDLGAPADPSATYSAARPEWFFLFLFQFLKGFPGGTEVWGAVVIPTVVFGLFALMPCLGRSRGGHGFNVALVSLLALGAAALTHRAWREDQADPIYRAAVTQAARDAARARALAMAPAGIPREGALVLLRQDPLTQGPRLFRQHCASCHRYDGHDGTGLAPREEPTAADLAGFGSRPWLAGLLDPARVASLHYFGGTRFKNGQMVRFVQQHVAALPPEGQRQIDQVIRALSGEAQLPGQRQRDQQEADLLAEGRQWLAHEAMRCTECHRFHDQGEDPSGPDLTGYGSRPWLVDFIAQPAHERFYGRRNDRMPQFGRDQILEPAAIGLIADWLRGDWYEPAP